MNRSGHDGQVRFGVLYNMRNPPSANRSYEELYAQVLEQVQWAETLGIDSTWVPEHHFVHDGNTPSPLVVLAAIAARTSRMQLGTGLVIPAFHNPIRLAEDVATLSIISNGRFDFGMALGYREEDFEAFGQRLINRVSLLEETVEVMRRVMRAQSIAFDARRFHLPDVTITPIPSRSPRILLGGETEAAIERVARLGDGFLSTNRDNNGIYLRALAAAGKDPADGYICAVNRIIIAEDPDATWATIGDFALYHMNHYVSIGAFPDVTRFSNRDDLIRRGWFTLMDGPLAVEYLTELLGDCPQIRDIHHAAFLPGESVGSSSARLEYYAREVIPRVRNNLSKLTEQPRHSSPA